MKNKIVAFFILHFSLFALHSSLIAFALDLEGKNPDQIKLIESIRSVLTPALETKKKEGTVLLLSFDELYAPLNDEQKKFMETLKVLKPWNANSLVSDFQEWVWLRDQKVRKDNTESLLDPAVLPKEAFVAYVEMNEAMKKDLGKGLLVESGYRSPAYQLYLFLFFMPNHAYSITETEKNVALPGRSEHGRPNKQAIDFINEEGINGEYHPEEFEVLPEYAWLQKNAARFGFFLSYPRGGTSAFEPWHWHFEAKPRREKSI